MITNRVFEKALRGCFKGKELPERVAVALSGGVDSLCLTYLLGQLRLDNPHMHITAVTIDHEYRAGSSQEAIQVGKLVLKWGVHHIVKALKYEGRKLADITNFEEVAREKRYEVFEQTCRELGVKHLLVAHNLNDQLETYLQRLQQNSSIFGLVGLRQVGHLPTSPRCPTRKEEDIQVVRPLLSFDKSEIIDTCETNGISWFEDHTNANIHLTKRNLLRHIVNEIIPRKLGDHALLPEERSRILPVAKESLIETHEQIVAIVSTMESQVASIVHYLKQHEFFSFDSKSLLLGLTLPFGILDSYDPMVLSRFFYCNLYPLSSVKHYHWSYAKLERHAVPRLLSFYKQVKEAKTNSKTKLTYLNVLFDVEVDIENRRMHLSLTRQPLIQEEFAQICISCTLDDKWSDWLLFDRRYWIRLRLHYASMGVTIVPYKSNDNFSKKQLSLAFDNSKNTKLFPTLKEGVPLIFANIKSEPYASLPTYNIFSRTGVIDVEWCPKNNLYSL